MRILKFGGTSVRDPERVRRVVEIVRRAREAGPVAVVVSAFGGVTDALLKTAGRAEALDPEWERGFDDVAERHLLATRELARPEARELLEAEVRDTLAAARELVHGISMVREASPRTLDRVLGVGERLSAAIVAAAFDQAGIRAQACDARALIVTNASFGNALVREAPTRKRIRRYFGYDSSESTGGPGGRPVPVADPEALQVITGFVAASDEGESTTLGRGGSDYTAALFGAALEADAIEIWTDVAGVLTADPRVVEEAQTCPHLSYEELAELSHFGAKVVYPPTVHPSRVGKIPLLIKNTFHPEASGTIVTDEHGAADRPGALAGITSIPDVSLFRLEGDGMVGVPGIAMRLFGALARRGVNVVMISQASSEHSICFAVAPGDSEAVCEGILEEFEREQSLGLIDPLIHERGLSVVAAVGVGMRERVGIAGRLFGALGRDGINVRAVSQGSSELNISLVVSGPDEARAIRAIHDEFFERRTRQVPIYVAGTGSVGGVVLRRLEELQDRLREERAVDLRLVGVANSRGGLLLGDGRDARAPGAATDGIRAAQDLVSHDEFVRHVTEDQSKTRIFVDCTASDVVTRWYDSILKSGASVVTANKRRLAGSRSDYESIGAIPQARIYGEATVGAGLPVLRTLEDLVRAGDRVVRIEGLLSGTLAFVMNRVRAGDSFSSAVKQAADLGYTEPDPREDLGGDDVARKVLILARTMGLAPEPEDVEVESLLPDASWLDGSVDEFWQRLPELDELFQTRRDEAQRKATELVFLATVEGDTLSAGLVAVGRDHPCARAWASDNLVAFTTERYQDTPLVVQGPGAGPEVTATGVLADVLRAIDEGGSSWRIDRRTASP